MLVVGQEDKAAIAIEEDLSLSGDTLGNCTRYHVGGADMR